MSEYPFTIRPGSRVKLRWFEVDRLAEPVTDPDGPPVGAGIEGRIRSREGVVERVSVAGPSSDTFIHLEGDGTAYRAAWVVEHTVGRVGRHLPANVDLEASGRCDPEALGVSCRCEGCQRVAVKDGFCRSCASSERCHRAVAS